MTDQEKINLLKLKDVFIRFFKELETELVNRILIGEEITGVDIQAVQSFRKFNTEANQFLLDSLGDKAYIKALVSPAQAEKLLIESVCEETGVKKTQASTIVKKQLEPYLLKQETKTYKLIFEES